MVRSAPLRVLGVLLGVSVLALALWWARPHGPDAVPAASASPYDGEGRPVRPLPSPARRPNVLLVVLDGVRADAVDRMPALAALAREGLSLSGAHAASSWTLPSVASLLTGLLPSAHGNLDARRFPALPPAVTTFAEVFRSALGYQTAAFTDGPWLRGGDAVLQGFETTASGFHLAGLAEQVGPWAAARDRGRPFLLLLHATAAAPPFGERNHPWPPKEAPVVAAPEAALAPADLVRALFIDRALAEALTKARGRAWRDEALRHATAGFRAAPDPALAGDLRAAYEAGLAWVDGLLAQGLAWLEGQGLLRDTLVVVTSSHGMALGERGFLGHDGTLDDEVLRVPLVLRGPAPFAGGRVVPGTVGLVDLLPTVLDAIGVPSPQPIEGRSLLPLDAGTPPSHAVTAEGIRSRESTGADAEVALSAVRAGPWRYDIVYDRGAGTILETLVDLSRDPAAARNLWALAPGEVAIPPEVCAAVVAARERILGAARVDQRRAGTPYGAGVGSVEIPPPGPCR